MLIAFSVLSFPKGEILSLSTATTNTYELYL